MAEYIKREDVIEKLTGVFQLQAETAKAIVDAIPAADVVDRDEGIRMDVELAAMHGADATSKQLEDAFWRGFKEAWKKRGKHGKWILKQEYNICEEDGEKYWECSLCGCGSDSYDTTFHTNFCPNCGCQMDGEDDA